MNRIITAIDRAVSWATDVDGMVRILRGPCAGMYLSMDRHQHFLRSRIALGLYEPWGMNAIVALGPAKNGAVAVDVGCGDGIYTLLLARLGYQVYAYDANYNHALNAEKSLLANGFKNAIVAWSAISTKDFVKLYSRPDIPYSCGSKEFFKREEGFKKVDRMGAVELDRCPQRPNIIKIDVDGFEMDVLRSAAETIKTHRPTILLEATSPEPLRWLRRRGYRCVHLHDYGKFVCDYLCIP